MRWFSLVLGGINAQLGWLDNMEWTGSKQRLQLSSDRFVCIDVNKFPIVFTTNRLFFPYQPARAFCSEGFFTCHRTNIFVVNTANLPPPTSFLMSEFPCVSLTLSQGINRLEDLVPGPYLVFISVVLFETTPIQQLTRVSVWPPAPKATLSFKHWNRFSFFHQPGRRSPRICP